MGEKKYLLGSLDPKSKRSLGLLSREFAPKRTGEFFNPTYSTGSVAPAEPRFGAFKRGREEKPKKRKKG